ncbi:MAG: CsbD family protein [Proteobacteria bacterium]|nr:CsbD family protein [Pseudomonadota bacterium]
MNKDQVKGVAKEIAGKVQEASGKLVGSKEQQVKGLGKQISGKAEKTYGDAKEVVKNANKHS